MQAKMYQERFGVLRVVCLTLNIQGTSKMMLKASKDLLFRSSKPRKPQNMRSLTYWMSRVMQKPESISVP